MTSSRADQLEPVTYHRDAVLTVSQVARGLGISVRSVERADLPMIYIGRLQAIPLVTRAGHYL